MQVKIEILKWESWEQLGSFINVRVVPPDALILNLHMLYLVFSRGFLHGNSKQLSASLLLVLVLAAWS